MHQVLAIERIGPLRRGNFVLCTTNLRSWIAADATHLHHTIFIKTANSVCRGAGDSHLPRSMRARSPHGLFPPSAVPPLRDEERSSESRRAQCITSGIPPELSNLILQVLAIERVGPLRRGISCCARPTYAVGSRQMQRTCTGHILNTAKLQEQQSQVLFHLICKQENLILTFSVPFFFSFFYESLFFLLKNIPPHLYLFFVALLRGV